MTDPIDTILNDRRFVADLLLGGLDVDAIDTDATDINEAATEGATGAAMTRTTTRRSVKATIELEIGFERWIEIDCEIIADVTPRLPGDHDTDGCGTEPMIEIQEVRVLRTRSGGGLWFVWYDETMPGWLVDHLLPLLRDEVEAR